MGNLDAGCVEKLSQITGLPPNSTIIVRACSKYLESLDPAWLYHEYSTLEPEVGGGEVSYPEPSDEYYKTYKNAVRIPLPPPQPRSGVDVLEAIRSRRSRRKYSRQRLSLKLVSTLLYHVAGVTGRAWWGGPKRAYPSSGARQPAEVYIVARIVEGVEPGLYHYHPGDHALEKLKEGIHGVDSILYPATLEQEHVVEAPLTLIVTVVYPRTALRYAWRAYRYVHWDVGFLGQNVYLVCEALGLATVAVGAFRDRELCRLLDIDCFREFPMLLFPVGVREEAAD